MKTTRRALWLLLFSQAMFLVSAVIEPPTSLLMVIFRVVLPLSIILFLGLMLAEVIPSKK